MFTQREIRKRIAVVQSTRRITSSMKHVAAARLRGAQQKALSDRPYTRAIHEITARVSRRLGRDAPLMWRRPRSLDCVDLVVITSDRGLCGGFNENLLHQAEDGILDHLTHNIAVRCFAAGRQGARWLASRGYDVVEPPREGGREAAAAWIMRSVWERYERGESAGCNLAFNRFVSASRHKAAFWNLLPLSHRGFDREHNIEYIYEPTREELLDALARESLTSAMNQAFLESEAAEHSARMTAMDAATRNADDMIAHLRSIYNRARQEHITSELMDIVNGAEALRMAQA